MKGCAALKTIKTLAVIITLFVTSYFSCYAMDGEANLVETNSDFPISFDVGGINQGCGNIIGVQPCLSPLDYANQQSFFKAMERYLRAARCKGWLSPKTVVHFPEYIGTWLVAANETESVYTAQTTNEAIQRLIANHQQAFLQEMAGAGRYAQDTVTYSVFKLKAQQSAQIYHEVFSRLAQKYRVTIAAGSILLPNPEIKDGLLQTSDGPLYNVAIVYRPNGKPYRQIAYKSYITTFEAPYTAAGNPENLPVYATPAGNVGILICADAWYPLAYSVLRRQQVDLILVPSFKTMEARLDKVWEGYNNHPVPEDVDLNDIGKLTEEQAILKYSLAGRMNSSGAKCGMNVFLRGTLWDMATDGYTISTDNRGLYKGSYVSGAALFNQWIP